MYAVFQAQKAKLCHDQSPSLVSQCETPYDFFVSYGLSLPRNVVKSISRFLSAFLPSGKTLRLPVVQRSAVAELFYLSTTGGILAQSSIYPYFDTFAYKTFLFYANFRRSLGSAALPRHFWLHNRITPTPYFCRTIEPKARICSETKTNFAHPIIFVNSFDGWANDSEKVDHTQAKGKETWFHVSRGHTQNTSRNARKMQPRP